MVTHLLCIARVILRLGYGRVEVLDAFLEASGVCIGLEIELKGSCFLFLRYVPSSYVSVVRLFDINLRLLREE